MGCPTLFELAAHPRRLRQHHQPHLQTVLLQEETCHHPRGPQHQVCIAPAGQTGRYTRAAAELKLCTHRGRCFSLVKLLRTFDFCRLSVTTPGGFALLCPRPNTSWDCLSVSEPAAVVVFIAASCANWCEKQRLFSLQRQVAKTKVGKCSSLRCLARLVK